MVKQSHVSELGPPLLRPFKMKEAAGQAEQSNCRAHHRLWQSAGQMPTCLRAPEGHLHACFVPWLPSWVPKPQVFVPDPASEARRDGCSWLRTVCRPCGPTSYSIAHFPCSFKATALCSSGLGMKG